MEEESSELITLSDNPALTREEYLERDYWTLQYYFETLLKEDKGLANKFIIWALSEMHGLNEKQV